MTTDSSRPLRADAIRNSEKLLRAARQVWAEQGPDAPLEEIARRAGVGIATLYRRFPDKAVLARNALDQSFTEDIAPAIEQAMSDDDPKRGLVTVLEATLSVAAREHNTVAAARDSGAITREAGTRSFESLTLLARRAQEAGLIRADLVPDDMPRIMVMLVGLMWTMDPHSDGWRRYLSLILDALAPDAATPLPAAVPLQQPDNWLL
ncbi:helix-turn-helix domain-containing protein [Nonomuraea sp. NPDC003709]|uniref:TetR/AcrR family transcriptional regulator n=1 Tax=Nonomuraea sp. NPDC003709 TaxID=3154450 RepID=UPI0033AE15D5